MRTMMTAMVLALSIGGVAAQTTSPGENAGRPVATQAQNSGGLAKEDLPRFLQAMGYESEDGGNGVRRLTIERGKWRLKIEIGLSSNQKKLWITSYLAELKDVSKIPASALTKLMAANDDIGPAHFMIYKDKAGAQWLKIGLGLDNRHVTAAWFRDELDWLLDRITETSDLWSGSVLQPAPAKP